MNGAFGRMIWAEKIPAEPGKQFRLRSFVFWRRLPGCILGMALVVLPQGCSRLDTQGEPQATKPSKASIAYIGAWGMKGSDPGQLDQPTGIAADVLGNSYIADIGSQFIHKFDARGTPLLAFQDPPLAHPQSVAVDRGGAIYVSDPARNSVFVYFPNGDRYREIHLPGRGNAENVLSVAVDDDGIIYVFDSAEGKVFSYTSRFKLIHTWPPFGNSPNSRGREGAIASGSDGYLYLADPVGNDIMRIMGNGSVSLVIHAVADGVNRKLSAQFAAANKLIFAMDADGRMLHIWTNDGKPVLDGDLAPELGQGSRYPPALAVSTRGELLVLDNRETRVLRYKINF
jgi:DNA-binding beta-propeller fold protein YncE